MSVGVEAERAERAAPAPVSGGAQDIMGYTFESVRCPGMGNPRGSRRLSRGKAETIMRKVQARARQPRGLSAVMLCCCLAAALVGVIGLGEQGPHGTRCMPDVLSAGGGKVVIYDTVVSVPMRRLFLIGPNKPLWVVRKVPEQQAKTVPFSSYFDSRPNPSTGSTCRFSLASGGQDVVDPAGEGLLNTVGFIHDPISNVNVAFCSIPDAVLDYLQGNGTVSVTVTLIPLARSEGQEKVVLDKLPVCIAGGAGLGGRPPVYASLCCIIRDEGRYLVEWIEYSRMIGVEHFYLYDHGSTDETLEEVAGYVAAGIVTLHHWPFPGYPQREAHSHCTHRYAHATTWLGLMDVDEFIVPMRSRTLVPLLEHFELDAVVLRLQAAMFGTSGHVARPEGLVIEHYVMRNLSTWWPISPQHKVWFRPGSGQILLPSIHAVDAFTEGLPPPSSLTPYPLPFSPHLPCLVLLRLGAGVGAIAFALVSSCPVKRGIKQTSKRGKKENKLSSNASLSCVLHASSHL